MSGPSRFAQEWGALLAARRAERAHADWWRTRAGWDAMLLRGRRGRRA